MGLSFIQKTFICFFSIVMVLQVKAQPIGYGYAKSITIDYTKVSGSANHSNFTLYFTTIDNDLRTVSNGGHVTNANGYDIVFTASDCSVSLSHQVEKYDPTTGELVAWIRIPSLSVTANTTIQMYYGNSTVTTSTSTTATWASDYTGVWHLSQNPGGTAPQMSDATSAGRHGTCNGAMTSANLVSSKLGDGITFDESNDYIVVNNHNYTASFTVSFWFQIGEVNGNSFQYLFSHGSFGTFESCNIYFGEDNLAYAPDRGMLKTIFQDSLDATSTAGLDAGTTFVDGQWHYYSLTVGDLGGARVYVDGVQIAYVSFLGGNPYNPTTNIFFGARCDLSSTRYYGAKMDEIRISNSPKSADWILTEYQNQNNPNSFYSIGAEQAAIIACVILPIELAFFDVQPTIDQKVEINWVTLAEINNDYFTVERSLDGVQFEVLNNIEGAGTSNQTHSYSTKDWSPLSGTSYYRLRQTDYDGVFSYSEIKSIVLVKDEQVKVYPNPIADNAQLAVYSTEDNANCFVNVYAQSQELVVKKQVDLIKGQNTLKLPMANLPAGCYVVEVVLETKRYFAKIIKV